MTIIAKSRSSPAHTITEIGVQPEWDAEMAMYRRNAQWISDHGIDNWDQYRGQYIAVSEGEIFAHADAAEARRLALNAHPHDMPFVQFVQRERRVRI